MSRKTTGRKIRAKWKKINISEKGAKGIRGELQGTPSIQKNVLAYLFNVHKHYKFI